MSVPFVCQLPAGKARLEGGLARLELLLAERTGEDEVRNAVAEVGEFPGHPARAPAQRHVNAQGAFGLEVGVAHLECEVAMVLAEEEQLLHRGRAGGVSQADGKGQ